MRLLGADGSGDVVPMTPMPPATQIRFWQPIGLEKPRGQVHIEAMALTVLKVAVLAGLTVVTLGVFPDKLRGAVLAIGTGVAAAVVLHFVAP